MKNLVPNKKFFILLTILFAVSFRLAWSQPVNLKYHFFKPEDIRQIRVWKHEGQVIVLDVFFKNKVDGANCFVYNPSYENDIEQLKAYTQLSQLADMIKKGQITGFLYKLDETLGAFNAIYFDEKISSSYKAFKIRGFYYLPWEKFQIEAMEIKKDDKTILPRDQVQAKPVDISGRWSSNIGLVFIIKQQGNQFSWIIENMDRPATGKINENKVSATWKESREFKSAKGVITKIDPEGRATIIEWDNNIVFHRD